MNEPLDFRLAAESDLPALEEIRRQAFAPVFDSFREILGETIYALAQEAEDAQQGQVLVDLFSSESVWRVFVAEWAGRTVGFVSIRLDDASKVGEIGLNAVDPSFAGRGIGTEMYRFATEKMRSAGMRVATVATGGDPSHGPARRAYQKAGFNVEIPSVWMCREL